MSIYTDLEKSSYRSRPIEIYHFFRGSEDWFHTSSKFVVSFDGDLYDPLEITRGQIDYGGEDKPGALAITIPTDCSLGLVLQSGTAPTPISIRITRLQRDAPGASAIIFLGEVGGVDISVDSSTLQCWPFTARLDQVVPQGLYQKEQCQWNTYDVNTCKVDKATFTYTALVTAVNGLDVTVAGADTFDPGTGIRSDMFTKGILQKGEHQGMIDQQLGATLTLIETIPGLLVGDTVSAIAGDDRKLITCMEKFQNAGRRFAFAHLPTVNPFYGRGLE